MTIREKKVKRYSFRADRKLAEMIDRIVRESKGEIKTGVLIRNVLNTALMGRRMK